MGQAVEIVGQAMTTDFESSFDGSDASLVRYRMSKQAALKVYEESGLGPEDVDVIELRDCFSANELITYEALGLCDVGGAGDLIEDGAVDYGGWVVNPSGSLVSKGHPLGPPASHSAPNSAGSCAASRRPPGERRHRRAAAQPRPGRCGNRHDVPQGSAGFMKDLAVVAVLPVGDVAGPCGRSGAARGRGRHRFGSRRVPASLNSEYPYTGTKAVLPVGTDSSPNLLLSLRSLGRERNLCDS